MPASRAPAPTPPAPLPDPHRRPSPPPTALPLRVRTLGRVREQPYHSTPGTHHDDAMLTIVLAGRGRYLWPGGSVAVGAGMVGLVLPDAAGGVGVLMAEPDDPYDHLYCRFAGHEALAMARRVAGAHGGRRWAMHHAWEEMAAVLLRVLARGGAVQPRADDGRMERADAVLAEALTLLEAPPPSHEPGRAAPPTAEQLLAFLYDHIADPTDLDAMARHFGYSKPHLCRLAKRALGQTLQRAWEHARLERARVLLAQRGLPITHIARRVGYPDPAYFTNVFKRRTGQSPSAYRRSLDRALETTP